MRACLSVIALVMACGAASAQDNPEYYNNVPTVRGLCQKTGCNDFKIVSQQPVGQGRDGTLYRTQVKMFPSSSAGHADEGSQQGYVYCLTAKPAVIAPDRTNRLIAFYLAPYADKEPRETTSFYAIYFAACHGAEAGNQSVNNRRAFAQAYGYRVALAQSRTEPLQRAEDIMGVPERDLPPPQAQGSFEQRLDALVPSRPRLLI